GVEWGPPKSEGAPMTSPQKIESITLQIAKCAALLDSKAPGWAHRVPIGEVNVADVRKSPLAFIIGPHWETVITSKSAAAVGPRLPTPRRSVTWPEARTPSSGTRF